MERRRHLGRGGEPVLTRTGLPGDPADMQCRYIEAAVNGVLVAWLYAPNGNPQPGPDSNHARLDETVLAHAPELYALERLRCSRATSTCTDRADIYPCKSYSKNALVQPEPRAAFRRMLELGCRDAIRTMHPEAPRYTFWDYKRNRWREAGLRLDHLLLSATAAQRLRDAGVDRDVSGLDGASDHAPAWVVLSDKLTVRRKVVPRSKQPSRPGEVVAADRRQRRLPASRSWSSTVIYLRIALITRCLRQFWAAVANLPVPSLASPICCCAFTVMSSRVRCLLPGIR